MNAPWNYPTDHRNDPWVQTLDDFYEALHLHFPPAATDKIFRHDSGKTARQRGWDLNTEDAIEQAYEILPGFGAIAELILRIPNPEKNEPFWPRKAFLEIGFYENSSPSFISAFRNIHETLPCVDRFSKRKMESEPAEWETASAPPFITYILECTVDEGCSGYAIQNILSQIWTRYCLQTKESEYT